MYRVSFVTSAGKRGHFDYHTRKAAIIMLNVLILDYSFCASLRKLPRSRIPQC